MTIAEILQAKTRNDLIRLIVRYRACHWRLYRNAVILEVADTHRRWTYRQMAHAASEILGIPVSIDTCKKVCNRAEIGECGTTL